MDDSLWEKIDQSRGTTPRERWVREAVEERLAAEAPPITGTPTVTAAGSPGVTDEATGKVRTPSIRTCQHKRTKMRFSRRFCLDCGEFV
jgi:hypothetical protein